MEQTHVGRRNVRGKAPRGPDLAWQIGSAEASPSRGVVYVETVRSVYCACFARRTCYCNNMAHGIREVIRQRAGESLGQRVRRRRKELELTQAELARRANINQGFLSEIERDHRNPSTHTLTALGVALDVPEGVLLGGGNEHDAPQPYESRELPLLGSIPAGPPSQSQEQLELFPVLRHLWAPNRYCLRLSFDSMEPTLKPDDIVLVQYRPAVEPELVQGRICACLVDGGPTLKRVSVGVQDGRRVVILRGDNPHIPPEIIDDGRDFTIQGVVLCLVSRAL